MDDELTNLETELKRFRPAPAPRALCECIERELARPAVTQRVAPFALLRWVWFAVVPAAAAAVVVLMQYSLSPRDAGPARRDVGAEAALKPVRAENVLVSASDEGFVTLDDVNEGAAPRRMELAAGDRCVCRRLYGRALFKRLASSAMRPRFKVTAVENRRSVFSPSGS